MRFEIWLMGQNLEVQEKYWEFLKNTKWNKSKTTRPQYSVLEAVLVENPNFDDLDSLSQQIENSLLLISDEIIDHLQNGN